MKNVVEKALKYTQPVSVPPDFKDRLLTIDTIRSQMYGVEQNGVIDHALLQEKREIEIISKSKGKYQKFDNTPFTWRKKGLPSLAAFNLTSHASEIRINLDLRHKRIDGKAATVSCLIPLYEDIFSSKLKHALFLMYASYMLVVTGILGIAGLLVFIGLGCNFYFWFMIPSGILAITSFVTSYKIWKDPSETHLYSTYYSNGIIPNNIKEKIQEAKSLNVFKDIFLLAEADEWSCKITQIPAPRKIDPLIVGYDGYQFWLIASFNTTTLEQHIKDNWCTYPDAKN